MTETTTFLNLTTFLNKAGGALSLRDGGAGDRAVVTGNFIGSGGAIALDTFLGDDSSSSDRLVIDGGSATGHSLVTITNVGGPGAETTGNGILIVQSTNSGRTAPGAFVLGKMVAAGPYAYLLFRGGVTGGADNNWFLRSDIDCSAPGAPAALCPPPQSLRRRLPYHRQRLRPLRRPWDHHLRLRRPSRSSRRTPNFRSIAPPRRSMPKRRSSPAR